MVNLFFKAIMRLNAFLYRLTGGKLMSKIRGLPVLLLTTVGRKTGKPRVHPLGYLTEGDAYIVIASNSGMNANPSWFHNLRSGAPAIIEAGSRRLTVAPEVVSQSERGKLWAQLVAIAPGYASYARRTSREIPLIWLRPLAA